MPRAFKCNPGPRFRLPGERRMRNGFGEHERRLIEEKRLMWDWAYGLRKQRAFSWFRSEMLPVEKCLQLFQGHHAMMFAMDSAARRKPRLRGAAKRKQRRDQREAEQEQQRDGYQASHQRNWTIPTKFANDGLQNLKR